MGLLPYLASAAFAQEPPPPPSPARQCADAAGGNEVEVCLQLASMYPHEVDGIAAALRAHIDRRSGDDRELLQGLLLLMSTDSGVEGARQLGSLQDPRAVAPLAHAAEHRELSVAIEAVHALSRYQEGLEPLARFLLDEDLTLDLRIASAHALGDLGGDDVGDLLLATLRRRNVPVGLRQAMLDTLHEKFPGREAELDRTVGTDGSVWLSAGGAWGLGYTLYATGSLGRANLAPLGAGSGGLAGGTAGFLAGRAWPIEAGDAAFITTNGVAGTIGGALIFRSLDETGDSRNTALVGGLFGEAAGYGLGVALREAHPGTGKDAVEASLIAGTSALALSSTASRVPGGDPDLAGGIGLVGGMAVGHALAPTVDLGPGDPGLIVLSTTYGAAVGGLTPVEDTGSLLLAGAAGGALVGYGLAGAVDPPGDVLVGGTLGMGYGAAAGLGVGLLVQEAAPDADPRIPTLVGATVGLGAGTYVTWRDPAPMELSDGVVMGLATSWAAWQAAGWGAVAGRDGPARGVVLIVPAAAGGAAAFATPKMDVPITSSLAATSLGLWGGYVAGVGAQLTEQDPLLWSLIGSDVGLGVGAVAMSPVLNTPPLAVGLADAGGVIGGSAAALGANFVTDDQEVVLGASQVGAGIGFTAGALAGGTLAGTTRDVADIGLPRLPDGTSVLVAPAVFVDEEDELCWGARVGVTGW
jgi:hypothetical protein